MSLWAQESAINATRGYRIGESPVYETGCDTTGDLYRAMQREHGRCTGRVYVDRAGGRAVAVGWVFEARQRYEDALGQGRADSYIHETWVTVHDAPPTVAVRKHRHDLTAGHDEHC